MSMNIYMKMRMMALVLATAAFGTIQAQAQANSYYQKVSIDTVLKTKPALIYVSPKYQVTLVVNSREVTGVSLELSKQKLFSVTLADNHHMIFLDTLTNKGGADLNLILDDDTVLPIHLMVKDVPSGTRVYTFFESEDSGENQQPSTPAAVPQPSTVTPTPAKPSVGASPVVPAPTPTVSPSAPTTAPTAPASTPQTKVQAIPVAATTGKSPAQAAINTFTATSFLPQTYSALTAFQRPTDKPSAQMTIQVKKTTGNKVQLALNVTSPSGQAIRADIANLKISNGRSIIPFQVEKAARGRLLPVETVVTVADAPDVMYVQWPVNSIVPSGQYLLKTTVKVN